MPNLPMLTVLPERSALRRYRQNSSGMCVRVGPDCYDPLHARGHAQNYLRAWAHAAMHDKLFEKVSEIITQKFEETEPQVLVVLVTDDKNVEIKSLAFTNSKADFQRIS